MSRSSEPESPSSLHPHSCQLARTEGLVAGSLVYLGYVRVPSPIFGNAHVEYLDEARADGHCPRAPGSPEVGFRGFGV